MGECGRSEEIGPRPALMVAGLGAFMIGELPGHVCLVTVAGVERHLGQGIA